MDKMENLVTEVCEAANSKIGEDWNLYTYLFDDGTFLIRVVRVEEVRKDRYTIEIVRYKWNKEDIIYKKIESSRNPHNCGKDKTIIGFGRKEDKTVEITCLKPVETDINRIDKNIDHPLVHPNDE
jgi:hypothetical protein